MSKPLDPSGSTPHDPVLAALAACSPAPPQLDRDRLMFLAGRASAHPVLSTQYSVPTTASRLWPTAAAVLAATSIGLAVALFTRTVPEPRVVVVRQSQPPGTAAIVATTTSNEPARSIHAPSFASREALPRENYLRTREVAFRMGLDALGSTAITGEPFVPTYADLLRGLNQSTAAGPDSAAPARPLSNM